MTIRCPNCSTTYKVSGSVFDAPKPVFRCTRCKHVFMVQVRLQLTDEEAPAAMEQDAQPMPEASGPGDFEDSSEEPETTGGEDVREAGVDEDVPAADVDEDLPPLEEETRDEPELPLETVGSETESVTLDPVDIDVDEDEDPDDVAPSYRGFEIDTLETDLPETRPRANRPSPRRTRFPPASGNPTSRWRMISCCLPGGSRRGWPRGSGSAIPAVPSSPWRASPGSPCSLSCW